MTIERKKQQTTATRKPQTRNDFSRRRIVQGLGLAALPLPWSAFANNDYPSKPIEIIVPASAGGGTDALARVFAEVAKKHLPQPFIVNNKPGASGVIGMSDVLNGRSDGYKVCMVIAEVTTLPNLGLAKFDYTNFQPVARLNADPAAITVRADAPWNTLEEFLEAAKAKAGEMKIGNAGSGSVYHLSAIGLEEKTGIKFNHVPYSGAAPAVVALLGGHIDALDVSPAEVGPHVLGGKLKMLGIMADQRLPAFGNVPTFKERKIDLALGTWRGLAVHKATPPAVVEVLRQVARKTADDPALRQGLDKLNLGFAYIDAPEFAQAMQRDHEYFGKLIRTTGIKI